MITAFFIIISSASLCLAGWAWALAIAARATARIAAEDVHQLAAELDEIYERCR